MTETKFNTFDDGEAAPEGFSRRLCREWALQLLYQVDLNPPENLDAIFSEFRGRTHAPPFAHGFTESLVRGVCANREQIDASISRSADRWDISRMAATDRNVIRLAAYEILHCPEIPPAVAINEAVDIARDFTSSDSGKFVNGVLDRILKESGRAANPPAVE